MAKRRRLTTLLLLATVVVIGFCGLGARLVQLQIIQHDELTERARRNTTRRLVMEPKRGDIVDSKGVLLATSDFGRRVCANPSLIAHEAPRVAQALAPILEMSEAEILAKMTPRTNAGGEVIGRKRAVLKPLVPLETWRQVTNLLATLDYGPAQRARGTKQFYSDLRAGGIFSELVQQRLYPNNQLAAHVVGYVGTEEVTVNGRPVTQIAGRDGIERTMDAQLDGVAGWRLTEMARARELVAYRKQDVESRDGNNVVLTLDSMIQRIVETELAMGMEKHTPISISAIVVRPRTGEILAMGGLPTFDPGDLNASIPDHRRNRLISDTMEPGSTFKIVPVSAALNERLVDIDDVFDCERGRFAFAGEVLHDTESHGFLTVQKIIAKSSNIGAAKIAMRLGEQRLYDYVCNYGFNRPTGIPLPGEVRGLVYPVKKWYKVSIAQIPMGHGLTVTPLQMVMAMSAIANDGVLMRPMLVSRVEDCDHNLIAQYGPQPVRQVISREGARKITTTLKAVMTEGTGVKAAPQNYIAAGKTGTARKAENGQYVRKYYSSFIGFLPADNPEICVGVFIDEPKNGYYGGSSAGPVFKNIAERTAKYLSLPEDAPLGAEGETIAATGTLPALKAAGRTP